MGRLEQGRDARCCCWRAAEQRLRKEREECGVRAGSSGGRVWKVRARRWQSCSVRATTIEVCVVVSQDDIGTINMVVMGKGELNRGRVSADIWAAHGLRMAVSPTTAWPLSQARISSLLDACGIAPRCCVMQRSTSMRIGRAAPGRIDTGSFAISRHQGSGQAGRGTANFLAARCPRPHWLEGRFEGLRSDSPCGLVNELRHFLGRQDNDSRQPQGPRARRLPRRWREISQLPLFRARPPPS